MKAKVCAQETPRCRVVRTVSAGSPGWHNDDEELALLAKALGHPARVQIVRFLLAQGEGTCVCGDICGEIPLAQSTVSQHLKILKKAGLITGEVDGPRTCYSINRARLARCRELLGAL
ncbi:MAG: winged helix-turn-helix transcriptional regulator [Armatimonadetes bacterium]|nr:winged helix-turn-helix transcriptional regulator [Armatimonadota bacterium]